MLARRLFGPRVRWILLGLYVMLWAGPVGDANDLLSSFVLGARGPSAKSNAFAFDRAVGRIVLFLGWCCIARGLGGSRDAANAGGSRSSRLPFRLRWLPVPIVATAGLYVGFAFHEVDAQLLVVDVSSPPLGTEPSIGGYSMLHARHPNPYAETLDYLFGVPAPSAGWLTRLKGTHAEFVSGPTHLGLQDWRPVWSWLSVTLRNDSTQKGIVVFLYLEPCTSGPDTITVGKLSAVACDNWYEQQGRCLVQNAYYRRDAREIRVKINLAGLEPESYQGVFPPRFDGDFGGEWPPCGPVNQRMTQSWW
jgi:hypothetical protein